MSTLGCFATAWADIQDQVSTIGSLSPRLSNLERPVEAAGTFADGSFPTSVTRSISQSLDSHAHEHLNQLDHSAQEHWAFLNEKGDKYNRQFLAAVPNSSGYIEDTLFPDIFNDHLGLPLPSCEPLVNGWIGASPVRMDQYGNSLAASQSLPGKGFSLPHDSHKVAINDVLTISGFNTIMEAENIFRGKISAEHHDAYLDHYFRRENADKRRAIIPDILVQNYPASRDDIATVRTATARTKPAIFEIKGLRCTASNYPKTIRATDSRARKVPNEYRDKAHLIDVKIAPEETRPLNSANGPSGPFEKALRTFATSGPIPVVVGAFGETNKEFDKIVIMCSKLAAKTNYGRRLSPHAVGSGQGADTLLRIQFRRVLGVQFVKANARHKLERLHLVGSTPEEAIRLAKQQKQHNARHWNANTDCPSRFSANYGRDGNYQAWYEFRQSSRSFNENL